MVHEGIEKYDDVAGVIRKYYLNPEEMYNRARYEK